MPDPTTFSELQRSLTTAKHRKAILLMLIEHIDTHFLPAGGAEPEQRLLDDDKLPVPVEIFEAVAADTLNAEVEQLDAQISHIMSIRLVEAPPPPRSAPGEQETPAAEATQEQA